MGRLIDLNTLWIGEELHPLQQLCLVSAMGQGHVVRLFCYSPVRGVPAGVEIVSANEVMSEDEIFLHERTGSPAPFADRFRVKIVSMGFGAWIDTDMLFLRPLRSASANIFGWENERLVGNAVLRFDPEQSAFGSLIDATFDDYIVPPWLSPLHRFYYSARHRLGMPLHVSQLPYGTTGPDLLTWCIRSNRMEDAVLSSEVFYPVPYERRFEVFRSDSPFRSKQDLPATTIAIHLWFQGLAGGLRVSKERRREIPPVEPGSLLHAFASELGMVNNIRDKQ